MNVRRMPSLGSFWLASLVALVLLAGCAPMPQPFSGGSASPAPPPQQSSSTTPPVPAPRREPSRSAAAEDSTPSADAERVLATLPEPLSPAQQVSPPPRDPATPVRAVLAPEAAYDTLRVERSPDDGAAAPPVPAPTPTLGSASPVRVAPPDTLASRPSVSPPAVAAPSDPPPASTPSPDPCWRLQVAAPAERDKAESRLAAAQSLLVVPMVIVSERGLFKVRTRDCMTRDAADALKKRATDTGFVGAFVLKGAPAR